jgi:hypothetical protein
MKVRKLNWIDKIPNDKKSHVFLGQLVNMPFILFSMYMGSLFLSPFLGANIGAILCICGHIGIEIHQHITKTGKAEKLDALAGSWSAINIIIIINILYFLI